MRGEIIEDYPEDVRSHSCLLLGIDLEGRRFMSYVQRSLNS
ncbi:MAG: DUF4258 domain-containing protein [Bryobacteraceae bacterium]